MAGVAGRAERGSWLDGTAPGESADPTRLGVPAHGPGSRARLGRRTAALAVDWLACLAVSAVLFPGTATGVFLLDGAPMATLGVFAVENLVLVGTLGHTLGHRLLGLSVVRLTGAAPRTPPGLLAALVRTVLLCLVIPAVVWDADGRGLHDRLAGTLVVRR